MPAIFSDVSYVSDSSNNCYPGTRCTDADSALIYDVYYPVHNYDSLKLPAVILFHAGGFSECSNLSLPGIQKICEQFAKRGFVTYNVEYRRGVNEDLDDKYKSVQDQLAVYRGLQDARGAIRSIIKRQRRHNQFSEDKYQIDTTKIFVGGMSAGGVAALNAAWYTDSMVYAIFPQPSGAPTIQSVLGSINADFYYADSATNYKPAILGVISMWGGIRIPYSYRLSHNEAGFFTNANLTPFIAFHGFKDRVIPYDTTDDQRVYLSPFSNTGYNSESLCLPSTYSIDGSNTVPKLITGSGLNMYKIWHTRDSTILKELYTDCAMGHGLDKDGPNFKSDFGTHLTTMDLVSRYMVQRGATLFQNVMNGKHAADIGPPAKFTECENTRVKCDGPPVISCSEAGVCLPN